MLKVLITPPVAEFSEWYGFRWHIAVKQDVRGSVRQLGLLFTFITRPTQRQVRQVKKMAKAEFLRFLKEKGGAA